MLNPDLTEIYMPKPYLKRFYINDGSGHKAHTIVETYLSSDNIPEIMIWDERYGNHHPIDKLKIIIDEIIARIPPHDIDKMRIYFRLRFDSSQPIFEISLKDNDLRYSKPTLGQIIHLKTIFPCK